MQFRWYRVNKMIYALKYESILGVLVFSLKLICKIITAQIAYFKKEGKNVRRKNLPTKYQPTEIEAGRYQNG